MERSLPYERQETGRSEFFQSCRDLHQRNDAATREQLHHLGIDFDPQTWIDPMSRSGSHVMRRLFFALKDAGMLRRERRISHHCPRCHTVLVASEVKPTKLRVDCRYRLRFAVAGDRPGDEIEALTFFPELLVGAVALAVRPAGRFGDYAGQMAENPLDGSQLPILGVETLETEAAFLVPAFRRTDGHICREHGLTQMPPVFDEQGHLLLSPAQGAAPEAVARHRGRQAVLALLGERAQAESGSWTVSTQRCRRCETVVLPANSEQLFLHFGAAIDTLRQAMEAGAVTFSHPRWKRATERYLDGLEPLCISRQQWWGNPMPEDSEEVFSTWFSLIAWSLQGAGWPAQANPEPVDEVFVDPDHLLRWIVPCQLVSLALTGRPSFRRVAVHGSLHLADRSLRPVADVAPDSPDEERFLSRSRLRPMRRQLGNVVEPSTLIRRFGADALRLGYLLCLGSGRPEVVTLDEGALRRARRALHRLTAQISGLYHLASHAGETSEFGLADRWILSRTHTAGLAADEDYQNLHLEDAARRFVAVVEDLRRYGRLCSQLARERGSLPSLLPTLGALVKSLEEGFGPICPYTFSKLLAWSRDRGLDALPAPAPEPWLSELVEELARHPGAERVLSSEEQSVQALLAGARFELQALSGSKIRIVEDLSTAHHRLGPCQLAPVPNSL